MDKKQLKQIQNEDIERLKRIREYFISNDNVELERVFKYKSIIKTLDERNVFLTSFDINKIFSLIPFYPAIQILICTHCEINLDGLKPLLETGFIIPILRSSYQHYNPEVIKLILRFPHISRSEFYYYRAVKLLSFRSSCLCPHCVDKRISEINNLIKSHNLGRHISHLFESTASNLHPYIAPDFELLDRVDYSLRNNNLSALEQINALSFKISDIRTCQALDSVLSYNYEIINEMNKIIKCNNKGKNEFKVINNLYYDILFEGLDINLPEEMSIDKYLTILTDNREVIKKLVDDIIRNTKKSTLETKKSSLFDSIASLNEQILKAQKSDKYKILKLTSNLVNNNKLLITSLLSAGALGFAGNYFGCGITASVGIVTKLINGKIKIKIDESSLNEFKSLISKKLDPITDFVISKYLNIDLKAVHLWSIQKKMKLKN